MNEYDVIIIMVGLITTAIAIGAPVVKLNTAITRLIVRLDNLSIDLTVLESKNHESHQRIWKKNDEQDEKLADHENRLLIIEKEKER